MRRPRPFVVYFNGKPACIVHAYSAEAARQLIAARFGGDAAIIEATPRRDDDRRD